MHSSTFTMSAEQIIASPDFLRLRWLIQPGPTYELIHVIDDPEDPDSAQTPFQDEAGNLHPISKLPFTVVPTADYIVKIDQMNGYKNWDHEDKSFDGGDEEDEESDSDEEVIDLVNPNPPVALEDGWKGPYLKLHSDDGCITIGDYVQAVHPWLVALRPRYLREHGLIMGGLEYEPDLDLWFDVATPNYILLANPQDDELENIWAHFARCASTRIRAYGRSALPGESEEAEAT